MATRGNVEAVRLLLSLGAVIDFETSTGSTALCEAAVGNQIETILLLVENGAHIDREDKKGSTALIRACAEGRKEAVVVLTQVRQTTPPCSRLPLGGGATGQRAHGRPLLSHVVSHHPREVRDR